MRMHMRRGLTIMELLVVLAIVVFAAAIIMPALGQWRVVSWASACQANLHQIGVGMHNYAQSNSERLPHYAVDTPPYNESWAKSLANYVGIPDDGIVGKTHLRCPAYIPPVLSSGSNELTYGANFPGVIAWHQSIPGSGPVPLTLSGGAKLPLVPPGVYLAADTLNVADEPASGIFHPGVFPFTDDSDGDGVNDTNFSLFAYNGLAPRHPRNTANFIFADGSSRPIGVIEWINNEGGIWGTDDASYK